MASPQDVTIQTYANNDVPNILFCPYNVTKAPPHNQEEAKGTFFARVEKYKGSRCGTSLGGGGEPISKLHARRIKSWQ